MQEGAIALAVADGTGRGIPPENVAAIKAFVAAKREEGSAPPEAMGVLPKEMRVLPKEVQTRLAKFYDELRGTKLLQPDCEPLPGWKVFYAGTWDEAAQAVDTAVEALPSNVKDSRNLTFNKFVAHLKDVFEKEFGKPLSDSVVKVTTEIVYEMLKPTFPAAVGQSEEWNVLEAVSAEASFMALTILAGDRMPQWARDSEALRWEVWKKGYALHTEAGNVCYVCACW